LHSESGKKRSNPWPQAGRQRPESTREPGPGPQAKNQANFTDEDSRTRPTGSGLELAISTSLSGKRYHVIVGQHVSQNLNVKQEVVPASTVL